MPILNRPIGGGEIEGIKYSGTAKSNIKKNDLCYWYYSDVSYSKSYLQILWEDADFPFWLRLDDERVLLIAFVTTNNVTNLMGVVLTLNNNQFILNTKFTLFTSVSKPTSSDVASLSLTGTKNNREIVVFQNSTQIYYFEILSDKITLEPLFKNVDTSITNTSSVILNPILPDNTDYDAFYLLSSLDSLGGRMSNTIYKVSLANKSINKSTGMISSNIYYDYRLIQVMKYNSYYNNNSESFVYIMASNATNKNTTLTFKSIHTSKLSGNYFTVSDKDLTSYSLKHSYNLSNLTCCYSANEETFTVTGNYDKDIDFYIYALNYSALSLPIIGLYNQQTYTDSTNTIKKIQGLGAFNFILTALYSTPTNTTATNYLLYYIGEDDSWTARNNILGNNVTIYEKCLPIISPDNKYIFYCYVQELNGQKVISSMYFRYSIPQIIPLTEPSIGSNYIGIAKDNYNYNTQATIIHPTTK